MGLFRKGALCTHCLWTIHLHQKAQGGAHELASEVLTYGEVLVNNMNSLLVGTDRKHCSVYGPGTAGLLCCCSAAWTIQLV